jgi:hypothetical protein
MSNASTHSAEPNSTLEAPPPANSFRKPEGSKSTAREPESAETKFSKKSLLIVAALFVLLALGVIAWKKGGSAMVSSKSIAHAVLDEAPDDRASPAVPAASKVLVPKTTLQAIAEVFSEVKAVGQAATELINGQRQTNEALSRLEAEVSAMRADFEEAKAKVSVQAPKAAVRRIARPVVKPLPVPQPRTELLGVDVWDGRPSVAVKSGVPGDGRVRFLQEGDSTPTANVRRADPDGQRVTFGTAGGQQVILSRDPE